MVRFFQSAYLSRYLFILFLTIVFWIPSFIVKTTFSGEVLPLYHALLWALNSNFYFSASLAFLFTLFSALAFNQLCSEFGISDKVSTLGSFLFVLLASSASFFTTMFPLVPATFLLILLVRLLFFIPHSQSEIPLAFNSGFLVGMASLFYTQISMLILVVWIAFYIHRSGIWRVYVVSLIGMATPLLFIFIWYFWTDQTEAFLNLWDFLYHPFHFSGFLSMGIANLVSAAFIFVFVFVLMLKVLAGLREKSINLRRNLMITFYFFVIAVLTVLVSGRADGLYLFIIPSAILLVQALNKSTGERIINFVLTILILLILFNQYFKLTVLFL